MRTLGVFKRSLLLFGVIIVAYFAYILHAFSTGETRVKSLCAEIQPGMQLAQLKEFSNANGLGPMPRIEDGPLRVAEIKTIGRFGCQVEMRSGIVMSSAFQFLD